MIPQRITIENFLSFGPEQTFMFDESEPLWVLSGPNGVGKSTVFDAITYALFGCHRGGKQEHKELIRHGENGFRIEFEFTYDSERFRVARSRNRKGRSVQTVECKRVITDSWEPLNIEDKASGLTDWVEATIGLDYTAFTSSVLLKQGEADAFIKAKAGPRLELLKKIVQMQPFEQLADRVHGATTDCKSKYAALQTQFSLLREVTMEELSAAEEQVTAATQAKEKAAEEFQAAQQLVGQGVQYRQATARCTELTKLLQAAEGRAGRAEAIRTGYLRWTELGQVVPTLEKLEPLPAKVKLQEERLAECQSKETAAHEQYQTVEQGVEELESQRRGLEQAKTETKECVSQLERQQKDTASQLQQVKELAEAETTLAAFPKTLENELAGVTEEMNTLDKTITERGNEIHALKVQVDQQSKQLRDFTKVKTGVPCSRCGQPVSKEHASKETKRLEGLIDEVEKQLKALQKEQDGHETTQAKLKKQQGKLEVQVREISLAKTRVETLQRTLRNQNITATLTVLEAKSAEVEQELPLARSKATEATKAYEVHITKINDLVAERKAKQSNWNQAKQNASSASIELDRLRFEQATYLSQLPEEWKMQCPIDRTSLLDLQQELAALVKQNIAAEYDLLARDAGGVSARREEYECQQLQLKELPDEAKLPEAELKQRVEACKTRQTEADQEYQAAIRGRDELQRRKADHAWHAVSLKEAEEKLRLHKRLDELLGKDGLQRMLVRNAERELTASASRTLNKLTNGELSLELNPEGKGDEAFDLIVRQSNSSHITSVNYLSGSQKFRVSVALALAIGQYASGRNRPLESVIIDEGFGSLDRDGLDAMARELRELQRSAALKRIILVSHQDDFVANFPVGYRLTPGEQGTTAERWSR